MKPAKKSFSRERRERVISFRITESVGGKLDRWVESLADSKVKSADQLARRLLLEALPDGLDSALFKGSTVDTIPNFDVITGEAAQSLRKVKDSVIDCVVTSPPYYRQRVYGHPDEIGREKSPEQFLARLVDVFRECRRVLKPTGTLWVVIDDSYTKKQLLGIPWRLMLALQAEGWVVRGEQIWAKNGMCEGAKDRPTRDHEFVFLLTKRHSGYYYDSDSVREPFQSKWSQDCIQKAAAAGVNGRPSTNPFNKQERHEKGQRGISRAEYGALMNPLGRNKRSVWQINTGKLKDKHYAPFPEEIVRTCLDAGCPVGGVVLDPFAGACTTGIAALTSNRKFLGIDVVPKHVDLGRKRLLECESISQAETPTI